MEEKVTLNFDSFDYIKIKVPKSLIEEFLTSAPKEEWDNLVTEAFEYIVEEYKERKVKAFFARQAACVKGKEHVEPRTESLIEIVREVKRQSNIYDKDKK